MLIVVTMPTTIIIPCVIVSSGIITGGIMLIGMMPIVIIPSVPNACHYAACHNTKCHYAKRHYAKCHAPSVTMLGGTTTSVIMPNAVEPITKSFFSFQNLQNVEIPGHLLNGHISFQLVQ